MEKYIDSKINSQLESIEQSIRRHGPELIAIREDFHRHPELSFEEKRTSQKIQEYLQRWSISFTTGWVGTGVVATIGGKGPCIAIRADIDALPIIEKNETPYTSLNQGVMHACGHDVHTTCLLGAARALGLVASQLDCQFKLIFQPAEEKLPGGAQQMIREGVLRDPKPELIIAQHVHPPMTTGEFGFRSGRYMSSADELYIQVYSPGGHAALPQETPDSVLCASAIVQNLQNIISRKSTPLVPAVLTIGNIQSIGGATNVIPAEVRLEGTLRCMDEDQRKHIWREIENVVKYTAALHDCTCDLEIRKGYPFLHNDEKWTDYLYAFAKNWKGEDQVKWLEPRMTAEDFSYYGHEIPAVFYRLGVSHAENTDRFPVHHPRFDVDPDSIIAGSQMLASLACAAASRLVSLEV